MIERLAELYPVAPSTTTPDSECTVDHLTYHPALRILYSHFLSTLHSVCSPFTTDFDELAYIAAATWPGFVRPVLDDYFLQLQEQREALNGHASVDGEVVPDSEPEDAPPQIPGPADLSLSPPTEDVRIRLTRLFTPMITAALDALYPRHTSAAVWAQTNVPPPNLLSFNPRQMPHLAAKLPEDQGDERALHSLPRMAKFILVAAFLASTNPSKTDMRLFGRGPDERRKRRRGGSPRKTTAKAAAVKVCYPVILRKKPP